MDALTLMLITLFAPLVSAAVILLFLRRAGKPAMAVSVLASGAAMVCSLLFLFNWQGEPLAESVTWLELGKLAVQMGFYVDHQAAILLFVVTFVGFCIHVFSVGYMDDDKAQARFFGGLSIFMFSMLGIVLADNLLMIFVFWELVGFSSYMLIAHYWQQEDARGASKKAFIVNRVGDFGFLLGIIWAFWAFDGNVSLTHMAESVGAAPELAKTGLALLLMCGFLGKSAQFPLHVWLPDAMAGPTPISALIHAATMVAAGVYFLCRVDFLFTPEAREWVLWLSAVMTVYAGFCAFGQKDIKKILAYSTLSQLGYMGVAFGLGYPGLALFHLATHAFFKALLFLGSGAVIHQCHHEQDIYKMGGLFKKMPVTTVTFLLGTLALCGVYMTSGFFSKDAIIEAAWLEQRPVFWVTYVAAFLTALYMGRLFFIAFLGKPKSDHAEHAKEAGIFMLLPLIVLAVLAVIGGFESLWPHSVAEAFKHDLHHVHDAIAEAGLKTQMLLMTAAAWVVGLLLAFIFYRPGSTEDRLEKVAPPVYHLAASRFWIDDLYLAYVRNIQQRGAEILAFLELVLIQGVLVRGLAGIANAGGYFFRALHTGSVHSYVYWFLVGAAVFFAFAAGVF